MQPNLLHWSQLTFPAKSLPHVIGNKNGIMWQVFHDFLAAEHQNLKNINMGQIFTEGAFFHVAALPSGSGNVHSVDK